MTLTIARFSGLLLLLSLGAPDGALAGSGDTPVVEQPVACATSTANASYRRSLQDYPLPALSLRGMDDKEYSLESVLAGEGPVMVNFIFTTCPTICPVLSASFASFQQKLSPEELAEIRMVSITIDPEHDTPARLREYAAMFNASPSWRFYTGSLEAIIAVQKAFESYRGSKMNHAPLAFMRAGPGESWLRLEGFPKSSEMLAEYRALSGTDPTMAAR